jgi:hypothetical protein
MTSQMKFFHIFTAVLGGICLTVLFHRYTVLSGFDLVQADPGDSRLLTSILEHWFKVFRGIDDWRSPPWFFPEKGALGYSDILFGMAIPYSMFRALDSGSFVAMNLTMVLLSFLSYLACLWLLRGVLAFHWVGAAAGAAFFAFNYPKFAQLAQIKLRFDFLQPVILGLLLSLLVSHRIPSQLRIFVTCLGASAAFAILASTTFLHAWFLLLFIVISVAIALLVPDLRKQIASLLHRDWLPACSGLLLGGIALLPLMLLYLPALAETGGWQWSTVLENIPQPPQLLWMGTDNIAWGWLAARWPELDTQNWSEMRVGYGVGVTLGWAALLGFSAAQVARRAPSSMADQQRRDSRGLIIAVLLFASLVIVLLGIQVGGRSPWYVLYRFFPGGAGVRSVSRYILTLSLPLAVGLAYLLDRFLSRPHSRAASALVAAAVLAIASEQLALSRTYSADTAERFHRSIANLIDPRCGAFYLMPTSAHPLRRNAIEIDSVTEQTFDAAAYLAANADVAQNWKDSAWNHFITHGKQEKRNLSPALTFLNPYYQITASLAALAAGVPTVNGISARFPPGWDLIGVFDQNVGKDVQSWMLRNGRTDQVCLIEHDLDGGEIPFAMSFGFF